jgi:glycine hydroxymethyltransferase
LIFVRKDARELDKKVDRAVFPGLQGGPHENQIAAVAVALKEAASPAFRKYAKQVVKNAAVLASTLSALGWRVVSGGTDSHLLLVDTWMGGEGMSGGEAALWHGRPPADPSGIRLGTAAMTTRGYKEKQFIALAKKIDKVLKKKSRA